MATAQPQLNIMEILLWNLDGDDDVLADERLSDIDYVLNKVLEKHHDNLILFCQDKIFEKKHKRLSKRMHMSCQESHPGGNYPQDRDLEYFIKNKEACIYFPACCINKVTYVSNLHQTYDKIKKQGDSDFTYTRMQAYVMDGHALLVSWHGPHNNYKLDNRFKYFDSLVQFVEQVRKENNCDVAIVGGDFNILVEKLREHVCEITKLPKCKDRADFLDLDIFCSYVPPPDRKDNIIDYVVAWPKDHIKMLKEKVVCETYKRTPGTRPFDHPIIMYTLQYLEPNTIEPIDNEAEVVVRPQNYMLETPSVRKLPKEKDKVNENLEEDTLVPRMADLDLDGDKEESVLLNDAKEIDRDSKEKEKNEPTK